MAKKYNRGRQQKRNIDRNKLEKYREEIARELGVELPEKKKPAVDVADRNKKTAFKFDDKPPLI